MPSDKVSREDSNIPEGSREESDTEEASSNTGILNSNYVINLQAWGIEAIRPSEHAGALELAVRCVKPWHRHVRRIQQQIDSIEWHLRDSDKPFDILLGVRYKFIVPSHQYFDQDLQEQLGKPTSKAPLERCDDKWFVKAKGGASSDSDTESDSDKDSQTSTDSTLDLPREVKKLQKQDFSSLSFREKRLLAVYRVISDQSKNPDGSHTGDESDTNTSYESTSRESTEGDRDATDCVSEPEADLKPVFYEPESLDTGNPSRLGQDQLYVEDGFWTRPLTTKEEQLRTALQKARYGAAQLQEIEGIDLGREAKYRLRLVEMTENMKFGDYYFEGGDWPKSTTTDSTREEQSQFDAEIPKAPQDIEIDSEDDDQTSPTIRLDYVQYPDGSSAFFYGDQEIRPGEAPFVKPKRALDAIASDMGMSPVELLTKVDEESIAALLPSKDILLAQVWDWLPQATQKTLLAKGSAWREHFGKVPFFPVEGRNPYYTPYECKRGRKILKLDLSDSYKVWNSPQRPQCYPDYHFSRYQDVLEEAYRVRVREKERDKTGTITDLGVIDFHNPPTVYDPYPQVIVPPPTGGTRYQGLASYVFEGSYILPRTRIQQLYDCPDFSTAAELGIKYEISHMSHLKPGIIGHYSNKTLVVKWLFQRFCSGKTNKLDLIQKYRLLQKASPLPLVPDARRFCGLLFALCDLPTRKAWYSLLPSILATLEDSGPHRNPYCSREELRVQLSNPYSTLTYTKFPTPIISRAAAEHLRRQYQQDNCPFPLAYKLSEGEFKKPYKELSPTPTEIAAWRAALPQSRISDDSDSARPTDIPQPSVSEQNTTGTMSSDTSEGMAMLKPKTTTTVKAKGSRTSKKYVQPPAHRIQDKKDLQTRDKINAGCPQLLKYYKDAPYALVDNPPSDGPDPRDGRKASMLAYTELGWRLWNPATQADFDAQADLKNVYLSDPGVVFAYISLSGSVRASRFCSDFEGSGQIRRTRVPKGPGFAVREFDGELFYVVVEGTYALKGETTAKRDQWWLVSPASAKDQIADKKPPFSWGNLRVPDKNQDGSPSDHSHLFIISHTFVENHPDFWKDTTPYQYGSKDGIQATPSITAPLASYTSATTTNTTMTQTSNSAPPASGLPDTMQQVAQPAAAESPQRGLPAAQITTPITPITSLSGPSHIRDTPMRNGRDNPLVRGPDSRTNTTTESTQEGSTKPFRPTANIDRMIDTLTGSLRENLTSLLGANSEAYVRERMAGVAKDYQALDMPVPQPKKRASSTMAGIEDRQQKYRRSDDFQGGPRALAGSPLSNPTIMDRENPRSRTTSLTHTSGFRAPGPQNYAIKRDNLSNRAPSMSNLSAYHDSSPQDYAMKQDNPSSPAPSLSNFSAYHDSTPQHYAMKRENPSSRRPSLTHVRTYQDPSPQHYAMAPRPILVQMPMESFYREEGQRQQPPPHGTYHASNPRPGPPAQEYMQQDQALQRGDNTGYYGEAVDNHDHDDSNNGRAYYRDDPPRRGRGGYEEENPFNFEQE